MNTPVSPDASKQTRPFARVGSIWAVGLVLVAALLFLRTEWGPAGVESRRAAEKVRRAEVDLATAIEKRDRTSAELLRLEGELAAARRRSEQAATTPPPPPPPESPSPLARPAVPTPVMDR